MKQQGCSGCNTAKRWLESRGLLDSPHVRIIDVEAPGADLSALEAAGILQVPAFQIGNQEPFGGFRVDLLGAWYAGLSDSL